MPTVADRRVWGSLLNAMPMLANRQHQTISGHLRALIFDGPMVLTLMSMSEHHPGSTPTRVTKPRAGASVVTGLVTIANKSTSRHSSTFPPISGCALRITIYRDHLPGNGTSGIGCQKDSERRDIRRIHEMFDGLIGERCRLFLRDGAATG